MREALDAAVAARKGAEEAARVTAASMARAEKERDAAVERAKVATQALQAERDAVARLQRMCTDATSASLHAELRGQNASETAGSLQPTSTSDLPGMDALVQNTCQAFPHNFLCMATQLASARAERADALARLELAESQAKAAVAEAAVARTTAAQAAETARNAEVLECQQKGACPLQTAAVMLTDMLDLACKKFEPHMPPFTVPAGSLYRCRLAVTTLEIEAIAILSNTALPRRILPLQTAVKALASLVNLATHVAGGAVGGNITAGRGQART
eukprot:scaffold147187_cov18-Tisochrysis_lutea.AAC.1